MRILFLLTQDLESPSGLGRYLPLAQELVKAGHRVKIAALHSNYQKLANKRIQINGVDVHYVAQMHVMKQGNIKSYYSPLQLLGIILWSTWALTKAALRTPADVIHIAKPHPMNSIAGIAAKIIQGKALFLDCDDYEAGSNRFGGQWQQKIVAFFEKHTPNYAKVITVNTHFMEEKLISWRVPKEKIVFLPNGIDPDRFPTPNAKAIENLRSQIGLTDKRIVAYIGTISLPSHPIDLLIVAFQKIIQHCPNAILMIVGGGEDILTLKQLAARLNLTEQIVFIGRVPPEDVYLYYAISDVSVDPVHDDDAARGRAPLKLLESWVCGIPFVTANVGDRKDFIGKSQAGMLAIPGDPNSLAQKILKVLALGQDTFTMISHGKEQLSLFYWDTLSKRLEIIYQK